VNRDRHLVIVGAGPAGLATARSYRDGGGLGRVTMLTPEPYAPYKLANTDVSRPRSFPSFFARPSLCPSHKGGAPTQRSPFPLRTVIKAQILREGIVHLE
jgi:hypothetical protein